jgi:hypothetical protein
MCKKMFVLIVMLLALAFSLAGCGEEEEEQVVQPGLANPASLYCQDLGYTEETRENASGQYGVCIFPDGSECDTWDFLSGRCGQEFSYCAQQGFMLEPGEGNIAVCVFDDGSTCDEYLYSQGECKPGEYMP